MTALLKSLIKELQSKMSLNRLARTGLFQKLDLSEYPDIEDEILLYRAVLDKALVDMFSIIPEIKQDVDDWLDITNPDFIETCEMAMLPPELVFKTFHSVKKVLGPNAQFRKFKHHTSQPIRE